MDLLTAGFYRNCCQKKTVVIDDIQGMVIKYIEQLNHMDHIQISSTHQPSKSNLNISKHFDALRLRQPPKDDVIFHFSNVISRGKAHYLFLLKNALQEELLAGVLYEDAAYDSTGCNDPDTYAMIDLSSGKTDNNTIYDNTHYKISSLNQRWMVVSMIIDKRVKDEGGEIQSIPGTLEILINGYDMIKINLKNTGCRVAFKLKSHWQKVKLVRYAFNATDGYLDCHNPVNDVLDFVEENYYISSPSWDPQPKGSDTDGSFDWLYDN